jgi:hypothetical protein
MNRRIKKKIETRLQSAPYRFDVNREELCPIVKSYREIKDYHKRYHEELINCRHDIYKLIGYSQQLCNSRRLRKDRKSIYSW